MHADIAFLPPSSLMAFGAAFFALTVFLAAAALRLRRISRQAESALAQLSAERDALTRQLHLCAEELHALGLRLLGQPAPEKGCEVTPGRCGRALLCLAADLQDAAAHAAGRRHLREEWVALGPLLHAALDQLGLSLAPGRRAWRIAPQLEGLDILADRRALRGALAQVLTRAVRHTKEGDVIELRLVRADETFAIVVEDEGAGLAAEDLGPALTVQGTRGLGLGLAVARQLLQAHGGELTIEALRGVGARTWMTLPRTRLRPEAQHGGAPGEAGIAMAGLTRLVAEGGVASAPLRTPRMAASR